MIPIFKTFVGLFEFKELMAYTKISKSFPGKFEQVLLSKVKFGNK